MNINNSQIMNINNNSQIMNINNNNRIMNIDWNRNRDNRNREYKMNR